MMKMKKSRKPLIMVAIPRPRKGVVMSSLRLVMQL